MPWPGPGRHLRPSCHDHKVLAVRILGGAAGTIQQSDDSALAELPELAEGLLLLACSEAIDEPGLPLDELRDALAADASARCAVAGNFLSHPRHHQRSGLRQDSAARAVPPRGRDVLGRSSRRSRPNSAAGSGPLREARTMGPSGNVRGSSLTAAC